MPPEWMWPIDDEIVPWLEEVQNKRKERFGGSSGDDEPDSMMSNDYAKNRRK